MKSVMKTLSTALLLVVLGFSTSAQVQTPAPAAPAIAAPASAAELLQFETLSHDFGTIKEENGETQHVFKFTNKGKAAVLLTDVKASCGCTTPNWVKEKVMPGAQGFVIASYNPASRPGVFEKFVTVKAKFDDEKDERVTVITIKGNVTARPKTIADFYPQKIGNIRMSSNHAGMNQLFQGKSKSMVLKFYNDGTAPIALKSAKMPGAHITTDFAPKTLNPKDSIGVSFTFDSAKLNNEWGFVYYNVIVETDDVQEPNKTLFVSANLEEEFTPEQKSNAAGVKFDNGIQHDFGKVKAGDKLVYDFAFSNTGKSDLIIRKTQASCGCTVTAPEKKILKPGEKSNIKVTFDTTGKSGKDMKTVTVITNDPKQQTLYLTINAEIEAAPGTPTTGAAH